MLEITDKEFKEKYLYFEKKYINKNLCYFLNANDENFDITNLKKSLKYLFPYLNDKDTQIFINYTYNSNIEYSNRINLILNKSLFTEYVSTLKDEKIKVDLERLSFTKDFIERCNGHIKKLTKLCRIDTKNLSYIKDDNIYYNNVSQIVNKTEFLNNILDNNIFFKYLLHQDIHNSILNPIFISIMLTKYFEDKEDKRPTMIQLRDIVQIYNYTNHSKSRIEMTYLIKKFFIFDQEKSTIPIEYKINPYLLIKCEMNIKDDKIYIDLTF